LASPEIDEFERLLFDWEDGTLDAPGVKRLRDLLRKHPEVRKCYVERQIFGAVLCLDGDAGISSRHTSQSEAGEEYFTEQSEIGRAAGREGV